MAKYVVVSSTLSGKPMYYTESEKVPIDRWPDGYTYAFGQYLCHAKFYDTEESAREAEANIGLTWPPKTSVRPLNADEVAEIQADIQADIAKLKEREARWPGLFDTVASDIARLEALVV